MKWTVNSAAIALALATSASGTAAAVTKKARMPILAAPAAATQEELTAVRDQLKALADRVQKLEQSKLELSRENAQLKAETARVAATSKEVEKSNDLQTDAIAKSADKVAAIDWGNVNRFSNSVHTPWTHTLSAKSGLSGLTSNLLESGSSPEPHAVR